MENFSATPYFKEKVDNYGSAFAAGKQGRFAVLIENSVLGFIHRLFLQRHLQKTIQGAKLPVEGQAFLSREKAIEWLAEVSVAENQQDKASTA
jgi:hypothetical protein